MEHITFILECARKHYPYLVSFHFMVILSSIVMENARSLTSRMSSTMKLNITDGGDPFNSAGGKVRRS